ncbi:hypothetical protein Tco_1509262 [Tanacetum coccineum]
MASTTCEIIWLGNLLHTLGLKNLYPVDLFCDSSSAIQIAVNPVFHEKTKHFELDVHLIREKISVGVIKTVKVHSDSQNADIFTKCLGTMRHTLFCRNLGLRDMFAVDTIWMEFRGNTRDLGSFGEETDKSTTLHQVPLRSNADRAWRRRHKHKVTPSGHSSIWMKFEGNTRDLGSFGEETDKSTTLHQVP